MGLVISVMILHTQPLLKCMLEWDHCLVDTYSVDVLSLISQNSTTWLGMLSFLTMTAFHSFILVLYLLGRNAQKQLFSLVQDCDFACYSMYSNHTYQGHSFLLLNGNLAFYMTNDNWSIVNWLILVIEYQEVMLWRHLCGCEWCHSATTFLSFDNFLQFQNLE